MLRASRRFLNPGLSPSCIACTDFSTSSIPQQNFLEMFNHAGGDTATKIEGKVRATSLPWPHVPAEHHPSI
jgi:hypothetical protein